MNKKSLIFGILIVIIFCASGFFSIQKSNASPSNGQIPGEQEWKEVLLSLNASISHSIVEYVIDNDNFVLEMFLSEIRNKIKNFDYLIVTNKDGKILVHPDSTQILQDYKSKGLQPLGNKKNLIQRIKKGEDNIYDIATAVTLEEAKVGELHLGIKSPWKRIKNETTNNLPMILLIVSGLIGLILSIVGAFGSSAPITTIDITTKKKIEELNKKNEELKRDKETLKKRLADSSKQKGKISEEEKTAAKRIEELKTEKTTLLKTIEEKKVELAKLGEKKLTTPSPEVNRLKEQLGLKEKETEKLKKQIEDIKTKVEKGTTEKEISSEDIEEMKKEELELTQRIVKKRREEITLSQRIETKRKEELALERKIEALQKKSKELGS